MPDFVGIDTVPMADFISRQEIIDRRSRRPLTRCCIGSPSFAIMASLGMRLQPQELNDFRS
jgi:hypothetical protein